MAKFVVTPESLRGTSQSLLKINGDFMQTMESIQAEMKSMRTKWDSEAANGFISKFDNLKKVFDTYSQIISSYSKFLDETAAAYDTADKSINTATSTNLFS